MNFSAPANSVWHRTVCPIRPLTTTHSLSLSLTHSLRNCLSVASSLRLVHLQARANTDQPRIRTDAACLAHIRVPVRTVLVPHLRSPETRRNSVTNGALSRIVWVRAYLPTLAAPPAHGPSLLEPLNKIVSWPESTWPSPMLTGVASRSQVKPG